MIKLLHLLNGIDLIGTEVPQKVVIDDFFHMEDVHQVVMRVNQQNQASIEFVPWIPFALGTNRKIKYSLIVSINDPLPELAKQFKKSISTILQPRSGIII